MGDASMGVVDDEGMPAIPASALDGGGSEGWVEIPGTRWGGRYQEVQCRANFEFIEQHFENVVRVVADNYRALACRVADIGELDEVMEPLAGGRAVCERYTQELVSRLLTERIAKVEGRDAYAVIREEIGHPCLFDEVVRAYLVVAADTLPLPGVQAQGACVLAHEVVVERLVNAIRKRPSIARQVRGGAQSWKQYERWLR